MRTTPSHQRLLALYDTHSERVYRFCLRLSFGCPEDAEDLTQDVFLAALGSLPRFAGRSTTQTWLFRIAVFRSRERRQRRQNLPTIAVPHELSRGNTEKALADRLCLEQALRCLSEVQREAFLLVKSEGFTSREAAAILKVPQGTVQSRVHEAITKLRAILSEEDSDDRHRN